MSIRKSFPKAKLQKKLLLLILALMFVMTLNARISILRSGNFIYYPNIQAALNAAQNGDTINIAPGTYSGSGNNNMVWPSGKSITIQGTSQTDYPVINCGN